MMDVNSEDYKNEKVPTLTEVIQTINGQCKLLIEIKDGDERYPGLEKKIGVDNFYESIEDGVKAFLHHRDQQTDQVVKE